MWLGQVVHSSYTPPSKHGSMKSDSTDFFRIFPPGALCSGQPPPRLLFFFYCSQCLMLWYFAGSRMRRRGLHHSGHGKRRKQWNVKRTGRLQGKKNTHTHTEKERKKGQARQDRAGCRVTSPVTCPGCRATHHPRSGQEISKRRRGGSAMFFFLLPTFSQSLVQRSKPSSYMVLSSRKCGSITSGLEGK